MEKFVDKSAKTVDEAVEAALRELNTTRENVNVEILEENAKGVSRLFGNKEVKVRVFLTPNLKVTAGTFVSNILEKMDIEATISVSEEEDKILVNISGDNVSVLIGRRGETLDAIQYLTSLVINKETEEYKRVIIDIENYRNQREEALTQLAYKMADRVEKFKKSVTMEPMTPSERRIIHMALKSRFLVETSSIGEEPNRKIVIRLKK